MVCIWVPTLLVTMLISGSEIFWVDLVVKNPLDVEVALSALTIRVRDGTSPDADTVPDFVEVERIDDVILGARDTRTVTILL